MPQPAPGTASANVASASQTHPLARSHICPRLALEETQKTGLRVVTVWPDNGRRECFVDVEYASFDGY